LFKKRFYILAAIGMATGFVTGLFGGGGGMILVPLLTLLPEMESASVFPSSVCIILPICIVSIFLAGSDAAVSWSQIIPYLFGSLLGGIGSGFFGKKIPVAWLHRILGILILWGGIRFLWQTTI
jgi:uncharacterized membrane protein YfcA